MASDIPNTVDRAMMIAPAGFVDNANAQAKQLDPDTGGAETFTVPLVNQAGEVTHYGCNTALTADGVEQVRQLAAARDWASVYWQSEGWTWETALADLNLSEPEHPDI